MSKNSEHLRMVEALLFAAEEPLAAEDIAARLPEDADVAIELETLQKFYSGRGVNLVTVAGRYQFRTGEPVRPLPVSGRAGQGLGFRSR